MRVCSKRALRDTYVKQPLTHISCDSSCLEIDSVYFSFTRCDCLETFLNLCKTQPAQERSGSHCFERGGNENNLVRENLVRVRDIERTLREDLLRARILRVSFSLVM